MRRMVETAVVIISMLGWWGFVYPELSLTQETCVEEEVQESCMEESVEDDEEEVSVCIKSRLLEYVYERKKNTLTEKGSNYDKSKFADWSI